MLSFLSRIKIIVFLICVCMLSGCSESIVRDESESTSTVSYNVVYAKDAKVSVVASFCKDLYSISDASMLSVVADRYEDTVADNLRVELFERDADVRIVGTESGLTIDNVYYSLEDDTYYVTGYTVRGFSVYNIVIFVRMSGDVFTHFQGYVVSIL